MSEERIAICIGGGQDLSAPFDPRFGRAPAFLITDRAGEHVEVLPNPGASAGHGAGVQAASLMGDHKVTHVIAGHFGPKADKGLNAVGAAMWIAPEGLSAAEVLDLFRKDQLQAQHA